MVGGGELHDVCSRDEQGWDELADVSGEESTAESHPPTALQVVPSGQQPYRQHIVPTQTIRMGPGGVNQDR